MLQIWKGFTDSNCMNDFGNRFKGLKNSVAMLRWLEKPCITIALNCITITLN